MPIVAEASTCTHDLGELYRAPSGEIFKNDVHGVAAILAPVPTTPGHTLIVPAECAQNVDLLSGRTRRALDIVSQATGIWLRAALDEPQDVADIAYQWQPHAARERIPVYRDKNATGSDPEWLYSRPGSSNPTSYPPPTAGTATRNQSKMPHPRVAFNKQFADLTNELLESSFLISRRDIGRLRAAATRAQQRKK